MKQSKFIPYIVAIACAAVYISLVFNNNVWLDEAFSASIIRCDFYEMAARTFADTLPPFYNFSAWLFTHIFGFSTVSLKIFSVIPMCLLMLISAHFIPKIQTMRASCLYIVLITAMPHFLEYGVEIRMYSQAVCFASATAIFALCLLNDIPHSALWLIITTVLGAYTHQYALIAEAFVWLMLLIVYIKNKNLASCLRYAAICVICYIPCAILTVYQMKAAVSYFSASPATFDNMMSSIRYPFVTHITVLSALLIAFAFILLLYICVKGRISYAYYILVYALVTMLSFGLMSVTGSSFFSSRYLLPAIGILWLGAALSLDMLLSENKYVWYVTVPIIAAALVVLYAQQYKAEYVDTSAFEEFIGSTDDKDGYVIYEDFPEIEICLSYYAPWLKKYDIDEIAGVKGNKYVFVNGDVHADDISEIKKINYDLSYVEKLNFDRYTFGVYELTP